MKRRHALITSATVSVVVLGGAVGAAAWSGGGLLGFGGSNASGGSSAASGGAAVDGAVTGGVDSSTGSQAPGTTVQVRVVEDRIVVKSSGGDVTDSDAGLGRLGAAASAGPVEPLDPPSSSSTTPTVPPPVSTTVSARHHDDDDEYEEHDDEGHEYEHGEYEDD